MATLDETNIFGLPLKRQYGLEPEQKTPISETEQASRQEYEQLIGSDNRLGLTFEGFLKAKKRQKVSDQRKAVAQALTEGDTTKAYEGFTELPMVTDQLPAYMTPVLGNIIDEKERRYFGEKAGRQFKDPRDIELEMLMASDPRDVKQYTEKDPVAGAMSTLAGASSLIGIGEGPSLVKAGIMGMFPSLRKGMTAKTMDGQGGGSGGISDIPPEPKKDYAGFVSSVEKAALGPIKFGTGDDLIKYLESKSREGVSQNELKYIDFDQIRNNPDLTKEDVIQYIQDNRPNIYRVQRSEDNPTYRADESDNPLTFLPLNEEATRIANAEEQAFFRGEYAQEIADHNEILTNNPTLQNSNFVLNSENINDPSVLDDLERYLKVLPEAYSPPTSSPSLVKINYPDDRQPALFYEIDFFPTNPEFDPYTINDLQEVVKDGATIEFPALTRNADDIIEEASANRVSPDYGNQIEVYEGVGDYTGSGYQILGNDNTGYNVTIDGFSLGDVNETFDDLADARAYIQSTAFEEGDILEGADTFDTGSNPDQLLETAPFDVITGEATLPTRFGYQYGDYRLPMGGADNYREFTLHIANPKTATRYSDEQGIKHFGGGDELLHYRTTDRIDEDGKKVLFVEEIQSDLHSTASSTRQSENYEIGPDTKKQAVKELKDIFKDNKNLRVADNGDIIKLDADSTYDTTNMLTAEEVSNVNTFENLTNFGSNINLRKMTILSDAEVKGLKKFREKYAKDEQVIPDYPYKGNAYIELAVKDIMKLASEGDYDRVAFTNPATQLRRNNKNLAYIDSIEINQVPKLTEAEQQFNENWMRNRDRSMVSQMQPESVTGFNRIRLDGGLNNADFNSFVSTHTDFVVNDPQANKLWQDFHKSENLKRSKNMEDYEEAHNKNSVESIFARYDSPPTPSQLAEDLYQSGIIKSKKRKLQEIKDANDGLIKASVGRPQGALTKDEAYQFQKETSNALSSADENIPLPNKPFDEITFDDIPLRDNDLDYINQNVRRGISKIMRRFYDHTLPNVGDAGRYIVKQKGTGYKEDVNKFMLEKGETKDDFATLKFESIEDILEGDIAEGDRSFFSLSKTLKEQIKKDAKKGNIPESSKDSQVYQVESPMGSGKKPLDMYARIIPDTAKKFAQKYNKNAKPKLKRVLYNENLDDVSPDMLYEVYKGRLGGDDQDMLSEGLKTHESATIDITPEMRKAILTEGVNVMYKGGIVNKVKSMDKPIQGNRRAM